ncbi:MAG: HNH endonuclease signature motif containing protein [Chloroflexota bacterium]
MSAYISAELRRQVLARNPGLCSYCWSAESLLGVTFEVDHIIPTAEGGRTEIDNLCLACPTCNRHKASRRVAPDPISGQEANLFHPLRDAWTEHFAWIDNGARLEGLTPTGRATTAALRMNRPAMVQLRRYWVALGLHPPKSVTSDQV